MKSMTELGVYSEVGRLRKVMVHRPELSLERLTPANHDDLLFDDVVWVDPDWRRLKRHSAIAAALDDDDQFVLPPLPNTLFMRDSSAWVYNGVTVNPMFWPARRRESLNVLTIYRHHPMFQQESGWRFWY